MGRPSSQASPAPSADPAADAAGPLQVAEWLDALANADADPLDVMALDGFLVGVWLQPRPVPARQWLAWALQGEEGARLPKPSPATDRLVTRLEQRLAEVGQAIDQRRWFDPWILAGEEEDSPSQTVAPWVTGFAVAMEAFPDLLDAHEDELLQALALMYRHLDPDDLEDDDPLLPLIEELEPPQTLDEAVEDLVQATLLVADVVRPARR